MERYSIDDILAPFYEELNELSKAKLILFIVDELRNNIYMYLTLIQGYDFNIHGESVRFQCALVAFIGDTPAANRVGGFKELVSRSFRKCRQCLATSETIQEKMSVLVIISLL